jgi:hypothetical protein
MVGEVASSNLVVPTITFNNLAIADVPRGSNRRPKGANKLLGAWKRTPGAPNRPKVVGTLALPAARQRALVAQRRREIVAKAKKMKAVADEYASALSPGGRRFASEDATEVFPVGVDQNDFEDGEEERQIDPRRREGKAEEDDVEPNAGEDSEG